MSNGSDVSILRYLGNFVLIYIFLLVLVSVALSLFGSDTNPGLSIVTLGATGGLVMNLFIKRERRPPSLSEKNKLIWGSLMIAFIVDIIVFVVLLMFGGLEGRLGSGNRDLLIMITIGTLLFVCLISYFALRWVYGSQAEKYSEQYEKKMIGKTFD
jgi:hypothetical protein